MASNALSIDYSSTTLRNRRKDIQHVCVVVGGRELARAKEDALSLVFMGLHEYVRSHLRYEWLFFSFFFFFVLAIPQNFVQVMTLKDTFSFFLSFFSSSLSSFFFQLPESATHTSIWKQRRVVKSHLRHLSSPRWRASESRDDKPPVTHALTCFTSYSRVE